MKRNLILSTFALCVAGGHACSQRFDETAFDDHSGYACWPGSDGILTGARIINEDSIQRALKDSLGHDSSGLPARVDLVFVGDGYRASELPAYREAVSEFTDRLFFIEPFRRYRTYFRTHTVEVISNESGVDHDPVFGILRDTALDMQFYTSGIPRALGVNTTKLLNAARAGVSTDVDQAIAVANTGTYGGFGYFAGFATMSGHRADSHRILAHELGHSFGRLYDEYSTGNGTSYPGGEPPVLNLTIFDHDQLAKQERKWFRWLDLSPVGFDGPVSAFEGANGYLRGIYRPSANSLMRSIARPFNPVSAEEIIRRVYLEVPPIEDSTPDDTLIAPFATLYCFPMQPEGEALTIEWTIDGEHIAEADGSNFLYLGDYLPGGSTTHIVSVRVEDPTAWVIDPEIRESLLTQTITWTVGTCTNSNELLHNEVDRYFNAYQVGNRSADLDRSGTVDTLDFMTFFRSIEDPCGNY